MNRHLPYHTIPWWCADARTALLLSIWQHTGHQSLRLHHDSIFARLSAINWQFCHIGGLHTVVRRSLSSVRLRGTHCWNVYYATLLTALLFLAVFSKHSSSQSTIQGFGEDALCKLTFYITLHYKDTVSYCHSGCNKLSLCPHHIVSFIILHI